MSEINPLPCINNACCVTGSTKVWTVDGIKSFMELADTEEDVNVYCLDNEGNVKMSKMFHPRKTGQNIEILGIRLEDGSLFKVSGNHMVLTKRGYVMASELEFNDVIIRIKNDVSLPSDIDENIRMFTEYTGTKKGTVFKRCEVTGELFECVWDEREVCTSNGYESDLLNIKKGVMTSSVNYEYVNIDDIEELGREDVYNGTVAVYHNYFTVDENTNTIISQMN